MAVHNAIVKKAQKFGIIMEDLGNEEDRNERFKAIWPEYNQVLFGPEAKYLLDDMIAVREMRKHWASFDVKIQDDNTVVIKVRGTNIEVSGMRANAAFDVAKKAWQEARSELDIDDEEEDNEIEAEIDAAHAGDEEERVGSVVSEKYRARYAETGHPNNCGDWLREVLDNLCKNKAGTNSLTLNIPNVEFDVPKREIKTSKGIVYDLNYRAHYVAGADPVTATLVNTIATY